MRAQLVSTMYNKCYKRAAIGKSATTRVLMKLCMMLSIWKRVYFYSAHEDLTQVAKALAIYQ